MKITLVFLMLFGSLVSAFSGWNDTEWGMSADQVKKLYPAATFKSLESMPALKDGRKRSGLLEVPKFLVGNDEYDLSFVFIGDTLARVNLQRTARGDAPLKINAERLEQQLIVKYGAATLRTTGKDGGWTSIWNTPGATVTFSYDRVPATMDILAVAYDPAIPVKGL